MPSPEETKAMHKILEKMYEATSASPAAESKTTPSNVHTSSNVSPDAKEMFTILSKLESATATVQSKIKDDVDLGGQMILTETAKTNTFGVGHYNVTIEETLLAGKYKKKYYNVMEGDSPLYSDLALFESAMGIIKQLIEGKDQTKINLIVELDEDYDVQLNEAAVQKNRSRTITESIQSDVSAAKHSQAVSKMTSIKKQIKRLL